jgi:hypothetical protein
MTPEDVVRLGKPAVVELGVAFGRESSFVDMARALGLGEGGWAFVIGSRAGVLGPVDSGVVSAACGFFGPHLIEPAWETARAAGPLDAIVRANAELCAAAARRYLDDLPGLERLADLTGRTVDAADASGRVLFAGWRALVDVSDHPAARVGLNLLRLREHRGSSHLLAVAAEGLTPLEAILAGPGPDKAVANGWSPPYEAAPDGPARMAVAELRAVRLAAQPFAALDRDERVDLVGLLDAAHQVWRRSRPDRFS